LIFYHRGTESRNRPPCYRNVAAASGKGENHLPVAIDIITQIQTKSKQMFFLMTPCPSELPSERLPVYALNLFVDKGKSPLQGSLGALRRSVGGSGSARVVRF